MPNFRRREEVVKVALLIPIQRVNANTPSGSTTTAIPENLVSEGLATIHSASIRVRSSVRRDDLRSVFL